jgi:hypothetical protein
MMDWRNESAQDALYLSNPIPQRYARPPWCPFLLFHLLSWQVSLCFLTEHCWRYRHPAQFRHGHETPLMDGTRDNYRASRRSMRCKHQVVSAHGCFLSFPVRFRLLGASGLKPGTAAPKGGKLLAKSHVLIQLIHAGLCLSFQRRRRRCK